MTSPIGGGLDNRSGLLVPSSDANADDTSSIRSTSVQDSDSEDDQFVGEAQTSLELAHHDLAVLEEEEEREKLLVRQTSNSGLRRIFSGGQENSSSVRIGKLGKHRGGSEGSSESFVRPNEDVERNLGRKGRRKDRKRKKKRRRGRKSDEGELMYEMEEGGLRSETSSISSDASSEIDRQRLGNRPNRRSRAMQCCKYTLIYVCILILFLVLMLGAFQASRGRPSLSTAQKLSNGTSTFYPTTILISLDGFRADFLDRGLTPTLKSFIENGISPKYMLPSFPSVTFPNHFTLVTGLYPESHGIVSNKFWDPSWKEEFFYTHTDISMQPKWWNGEPVWVTAENQGVRSAIHMWPGSEAHIAGVEPTYLDKFNGSEVLPRKVDRILEFLDMPGEETASNLRGSSRPQFIASYVPVVDSNGHKYGPNSTEVRDTIKHVDEMLHDLFEGLQARNLTEVVNVVIVSDHGMATTSNSRLIQLEDLVDLNAIEHVDGWPLVGMRPKDPTQLQELYDGISAKAKDNPNFDVYLRDKNMPERYHFSNNDRISPLWIIPKTGWMVVPKSEFDIEEGKKDGKIYSPRGVHGYDHEHPLMRAIFVARGPAFPHSPNSRVDVFQNTEVYNIVCDSLGIKSKPNNGTLHLPLKPVGLHTDPDPEPSKTQNDGEKASDMPSTEDEDAETSRPVVDDSAEHDHKFPFWDYVGDKFDAFKEWIDGLRPNIKESSD